ncbi:MAG: hypothetical protein GMKNLPBB_00185 [Myxococcota bacterium]|nr:hypothetical protein [Myxococcota bacterium]
MMRAMWISRAADRRRMWKRLLGRKGVRRGQAMSEYIIMTFALLFGVGLIGSKFLPTMLKAYQIYIDGFMMILSLPFP